MTFITVFAAPIGLANVGWKIWLWILSGNIVAIFFVFFLCPETGGRTLEDVDYLFGDGKLAWRSSTLSGTGFADSVSEKGESFEKIDKVDN
jgi:hypothetical protein